MVKDKEDFELNLYEKIGIKYFKAFVLKIRDILLYFSTRKMTEEEKHDFLNSKSNYNIGKIKSLEDVINFKKMLYFNASIHTLSMITCLFFLTNGVSLLLLLCTILNLYCIILQRYNCIRINKLIKRMTPHYERQRNKIKEEIEKEDALLKEHTYIKVSRKNKSPITLEEIINNSSIEDLKKYRESLRKYLEEENQEELDNTFGSKKLKLEFKSKRN